MMGRRQMRLLVLASSLAVVVGAPAAAAPSRQGDEGKLAAITLGEIRSRLPPASSTVQLVPIAKASPAGFADATDKAVRSAGYAVASYRTAGVHVIGIGASPLWDGYVLHLQFGQEAMTRFYRPNEAGALVPAGPTSVREIQQ